MADLGYMKGYYPSATKTLPNTPGFEGSGIVVELGPDVKNRNLVGKRVAFGSFFSNFGTYAQYAISSEIEAFILEDNVSFL